MKQLGIQIQSDTGETKLQQIINELLRIIKTQLQEGDLLPSVNSLSKELAVSRDTVFKAYSELKRREVVDSTPTKGYYVRGNSKKVLLVLDYYSPFKDIIYREVERSTDRSITIDLVFHHYNKKLFESVILESVGRYNAYVVMNVNTKQFRIADVLKKLDPASLLLIDIPIEDWNGFDSDKYSFVCQDFKKSVYASLVKVVDKIRGYDGFNFVYHDELQHPSMTLAVFEQFCNDYGIASSVIENQSELKVESGQAYFTVLQQDIYSILTQCKTQNLKVGKEVGILAYNDIPLYEFVSEGISVITTDFKKMGQLAASFIKERKQLKDIIPTKIILRNSL